MNTCHFEHKIFVNFKHEGTKLMRHLQTENKYNVQSVNNNVCVKTTIQTKLNHFHKITYLYYDMRK